MLLKNSLSPEDGRIFSIFCEEFELETELRRLRSANSATLASAVEQFVTVLTSTPIVWADAERFATEVAAYGRDDPNLEHLRNAVMRALTPRLANLPQTMEEMALALDEPKSSHACALAAARIIQIFGDEFSCH